MVNIRSSAEKEPRRRWALPSRRSLRSRLVWWKVGTTVSALASLAPRVMASGRYRLGVQLAKIELAFYFYFCSKYLSQGIGTKASEKGTGYRGGAGSTRLRSSLRSVLLCAAARLVFKHFLSSL